MTDRQATVASPGRGLPWRRPRHERLVLALVALAVLTPIYPVSSQDSSRLCLTRAFTVGGLTTAPCIGHSVDRARYDGRTYSDKAPGVSLLALPAVVLTGLPTVAHWHARGDLRVWLARMLTSGVAFIALCLVLGRIAEGLQQGTGSLTIATFATGTLAGGLAATTFDQTAAAACAFGAFVVAWRGNGLYAGLLAGVALLTEYQAALAVVAIGIYLLARSTRDATRYLAGLLPGSVTLGAYDWAAFGSPFHASYRYVANHFAHAQASGFFGISAPRVSSIADVLTGNRGLLVASPVLVAAAAGLVALARRAPLEGLTCGVVTFGYLLLEFGYFLPYGGTSPGPRFLIPALPFLALGLPFAFSQSRVGTTVLAVWSLAASTIVRVTWTHLSTQPFKQSISEVYLGAVPWILAHFNRTVPRSLFTELGFNSLISILALISFGIGAFVVALHAHEQERASASKLATNIDE